MILELVQSATSVQKILSSNSVYQDLVLCYCAVMFLVVSRCGLLMIVSPSLDTLEPDIVTLA